MTRLIIIFCLCFITACSGQAQSDSLSFPKSAKLSDKFKMAIQEQISEYNRLFYQDSSKTKYYSTSFMLDKIDNDSNYLPNLFLAEYWIAFHYADVIPELIKRVTKKKEVGLENYTDLIIWERVHTKQMKFYGHGRMTNDDLFTVAGRANRLLKKITGEDFGNVSMHSTQEQLDTLQKKWIKWLKRL